MWKLIKILLAGMVFSLFYFPFEFTFLPGYNTKKILAALGLVILVIYFIKKNEFKLPKSILTTTIFATIVSIVGFISVIYNGTPDYVYSSYVMSMLVWLSSAFVVCCAIYIVHATITVELICNYLVGVCVAQCFLAQIIDAQPEFQRFINTYVSQGQEFVMEVKRLYGIGASLDVAGSRFAAALICSAYIIYNMNVSRKKIWIYALSYFIILVFGSMIARTTYVGAVISIIYLLIVSRPLNFLVSKRGARLIKVIACILIFLVPIGVYYYNTDLQFQKLLRFAFEGFFNLAETGEWSIASNEKLKTMYVFPDNLKTWIIGDGYFNNPVNVDPYYVGEITGGYYKGTDVGYLRFIFYFGLIGLSAFMLFFIKVTQYCVRGFPKYKWMFILLLIANFVIWLKVSTDIFLVFALFLCASNMQDEDPQLSLEPNPELKS